MRSKVSVRSQFIVAARKDTPPDKGRKPCRLIIQFIKLRLVFPKERKDETFKNSLCKGRSYILNRHTLTNMKMCLFLSKDRSHENRLLSAGDRKRSEQRGGSDSNILKFSCPTEPSLWDISRLSKLWQVRITITVTTPAYHNSDCSTSPTCKQVRCDHDICSSSALGFTPRLSQRSSALFAPNVYLSA